jgi:uncharacterized linocin/CFP29 family protein
MHSDLVELGWTEDQWNRIVGAVTEEAQKGRVAAQMLPLVGPEDASTIAVPQFQTTSVPFVPPGLRLTVNSDPDLYLTRIAVNVHLRSNEMADPSLSAALQMFRRAANYIARLEDSLVFYGRRNTSLGPPPVSVLNAPPAGIPAVFDLTQDTHSVPGLLGSPPPGLSPRFQAGANIPPGGARGDGVFRTIVHAIDDLDSTGLLGPFACVLGNELFEDICTPNPNLVIPRDRILPFLQGPLLRSGAVARDRGAVISLSGNAIELVVASDIQVSYLQTSLEPRWVFRVSERVAVRIKEPLAVQEIST